MTDTKGDPDTQLPIRADFEHDATTELVGRQLEEGDNILVRDESGLSFVVMARNGETLEYSIVDEQGKPLDEIVRVQVNSTTATTCWDCGVDAQGNRHCWKIPCPVITGPWTPGKVMVRGFGFRG